VLQVIEPGPLLTIQDAGRPGLGRLGVPLSGACDWWGLAVANLLVGAAPGSAGLEVTFGGSVLAALETCAVGLGGADLTAELDDGRRLPPGYAHRIPAGAQIRFAGAARGMRAYLALAGGIAIGAWMGSASTYALGKLGFEDGRPLRAGDELVPARRGDVDAAGSAWPTGLAPHPADASGPLGIVSGPDLDAAPNDALASLAAAAWRVSVSSDRMGLRLDGPSLGPGREIVSHPLLPGAVQLPADGRPIVMLVDGPTIGGYPVLGVVPAVDLPRLGQLRAGDEIAFRAETPEAARGRARTQRAALDRAAAALRADAVWVRLTGEAGG
jgi:antagonist of KipI